MYISEKLQAFKPQIEFTHSHFCSFQYHVFMRKLCTIFALLHSVFAYAQFTSDGFITMWKTDNTGTSSTDQISLPIVGDDYDVYWEAVDDASSNSTLTGLSGETVITFPSVGEYKVQVSGDFSTIDFQNGDDPSKILSVEQWGTQVWSTFNGAFFGCTNLTITATDVPDLSAVTDMYYAFWFNESLTGDLSEWDVSNVTDMEATFAESGFDGDLSSWDVSSVTTMEFMFF